MLTVKEFSTKTAKELAVIKNRLELVNKLARTCPALSGADAFTVMTKSESDLFMALNALNADRYDVAREKILDAIMKVNDLNVTLIKSLHPVMQPGEQFDNSLKSMFYSVRSDLERCHDQTRSYSAVA
ncbi:hypothetical protein Ares1_0095 [Vibrio phage Ares1]|nr:hypothetical protein Ares1_0095 [Vibrio phage Ares1]